MKLSRLRFGEWLAFLSAAVLLVLMFAVKWYGAGAEYPTAVNGWDALIHLRWLIALTIALALALGIVQATRRAPALPASISVVVTVVALLNVLWMAYRLLISMPDHQRAVAYIGFACGCGMLVGAFLSLRTEGIAAADGPGKVRVVDLKQAGAAGDS